MQRDASGDDSTWVGTDLVDHIMTIGDARSLTQNQRKTLAANGFELIDAPLGDDVVTFLMPAGVNSYYPECEAIVRKITGAKTVKAFDHNIRSAQGKNSKERLNNGQNVQGPVHVVHGDYTLTSSLDRLNFVSHRGSTIPTLRISCLAKHYWTSRRDRICDSKWPCCRSLICGEASLQNQLK